MKYPDKILLVVAAAAGFLLLSAQTTTPTAQPAPPCHYEIVEAQFLLNPCTGDSWYFNSGVSYSGPNEPPVWKRITKE